MPWLFEYSQGMPWLFEYSQGMPWLYFDITPPLLTFVPYTLNMYRTHTCGELRLADVGREVTLSGWVQRNRDLGGMTFVDLRDRYGITQLSFNLEARPEMTEQARKLGREFVLQVSGTVTERESKNLNMPTGEIEIRVTRMQVLNASETPPFTIDELSDGGDELRMKYRYLDLRRPNMQRQLMLRHQTAQAVREYLNSNAFLEIETPFLIRSTPEGARDFVVPSRMQAGQFYALPQSPQTFKQLLMVSGFDRYYQIVRCFRDEDLRSDRQPEFTQIDCEMAFVEREDVLATFEGLLRHIFKQVKGIELPEFLRLSYDEAMEKYGSDKPDLRFGMEIHDVTALTRNGAFPVFEQAETVQGICVPGAAEWSRKQLDTWTDWVKRPQIGAQGMVWLKVAEDGSLKSSVDKFYSESELKTWAEALSAQPNSLILLLSGVRHKVQKQLGALRLAIADELGLRSADSFCPLWVLDFPMFEFDEEQGRWFAMHHPFTSPYGADYEEVKKNPGAVRANAYDLVLNGSEIAGGSIRIHSREIQETVFALLGLSAQEAEKQFGFLLNAFRYGAPPHGGIAFGFDRLCSILAGLDSIRDVIAFPKNNAGRDLMIDAPAEIDAQQWKELNLKSTL
jgi:aspartyl-tRNA synthetase